MRYQKVAGLRLEVTTGMGMAILMGIPWEWESIAKMGMGMGSNPNGNGNCPYSHGDKFPRTAITVHKP